ncbi:3-hydroxyacyl-CoA dehydrogenase [Venturia nashicola]|uniref:3-hydroxyacyl-CoA dehydrogenase n=1 Tax=Venturia nashicola TaxID=86259 RepID=A0A4Z1PAF5_9PEZI|nr:3-hydroxyacyl-CoA dehydrogenase [Venturia nashicola]TLD36601.1 3-hydroxyacyl-CoA dehydrogenase [Venturia nashicola]
MIGSVFKAASTLILLSFSAIISAAPIQDAAFEAGGSRLYFLDLRGGRIITTKPDGTDLKVVSSNHHSNIDGIAVDKAAGYIYFSNMGAPGKGDGSIQRMGLGGAGLSTLVGGGKTNTPKQLILVDSGAGQKKLYWGDREGMKVMRSNVDGSQLETVVDTKNSACNDAKCKMVVGVAVDVAGGWVYWTQKGGTSAGEGSLNRAPIAIKAGESPGKRSDIQVLLTGLPEPIDLRWVKETGSIYWTDRGHVENGRSVNRLAVGEAKSKAEITAKMQTLFTGMGDAIGIAVHHAGNKVWATDLGGNLWMSDLEGQGKKKIGSGLGTLTGLDFVE